MAGDAPGRLFIGRAEFLQTKPFQDPVRFRGFDRGADQFVAARVTQRKSRRRGGQRAGDDGFLGRLAAGDFADQLRGALGRAQDHRGIDPAFETITGVARQIQFARGAANIRRLEIRAFEQDVARRPGHTRVFAAHYSADRDAARGVGDEHVLRLQ